MSVNGKDIKVPIPKNGRINNYDKQVSIFRKDNGARRRTVVGYAVSQTQMTPNENYKRIFFKDWAKINPDELVQAYRPQLKFGLYAVSLGIGHDLGLYPLVYQDFGPEHGNALMDCAMFGIRERNSSKASFQASMDKQALFSIKWPHDTWLSHMLASGITAEQIKRFRADWLKHCVEHHGVTAVWLGVMCFSNSSKVKGSAIANAEPTRGVSYIYAISEDGLPVTWSVAMSALPEVSCLEYMVSDLKDANVQVKGVIVDSSALDSSPDNLETWLDELQLPCVMTLHSSTAVFQDIMFEFSREVRWKVDHALVSSRNGGFGLAQQRKIFPSSVKERTIGFFFNGSLENARSQKLLRDVFDERDRLKEQLAQGATDLVVDENLAQYLDVITDETGKVSDVKTNNDIMQKSIDENGFYAVVSTEPMSANEINVIYEHRDQSQTLLALYNSKLAQHKLNEQSVQGLFVAGFISSVIFNRMQVLYDDYLLNHKRYYDVDVDPDILQYLDLEDGGYDDEVLNHVCDIDEIISDELDLVSMVAFEDGGFHYFNDAANDANALLDACHITKAAMRAIAHELNLISVNLMTPTYRALAGYSSPEPKTDVMPRRHGRPKGSRNKATLERLAKEEQAKADGTYVEPPKRGRGRPKGSLNKATLDRLAQEEQAKADGTFVEPPKRSPGRPKGSKNKKTLAREQQEAMWQQKTERIRAMRAKRQAALASEEH